MRMRRKRRTRIALIEAATAEVLEGRRLLAAAPMVPGATTVYRLEGGGDSRWVVQGRGGTSNGLPTGGTAARLPGLGISDASLPFDVVSHGRAFDTGHSIWVNRSIFVQPGGEEYPTGQVDVDGPVDENGEVHYNRLSAGPAPMSGLDVTVAYYAAQSTATLRTLAGFTNTGDAPVSATVTFLYNLGSNDATTVMGTSSGDRTFDDSDRWIVTDDVPPSAGNDIPAITSVIRGPRSAALPTVSNVVFDSGGTQGVLVDYAITVPAHSTRYLMYFTQMHLTSAAALAAVPTFDTPAPGANPEFWADVLSGISEEQMDQVLNWQSNTPPVANADSYSTDEDTPLHVEAPGVLGNDTDADGDAITAVVLSGTSHGTLELHADGSLDYTPAENHFGTGAAADSFTYAAVDEAGEQSEPTTVTIEVNPVNDVPTADAGGDDNSAEGGDVGFSGAGSDVEGDALTYHWDFGDGTSAEGADATHAYAEDGVYTAVLTVTDAHGAATTDARTVTVDDVAPTIDAFTGPDAALTGESVAFTADFSDAGRLDTHTASVDWGDGSPPSDASVTETAGSGTGAAAASHAYAAAGEYTVTMTISDDDGGTHQASLVITVTAPPPPPPAPVELRPDPIEPGKTSLYVTGTDGNDLIVLVSVDLHGLLSSLGLADPAADAGAVASLEVEDAFKLSGAVEAFPALGEAGPTGDLGSLVHTYVVLNGQYMGSFQPTARSIVYGGAGNDAVLVLGGGRTWVYGDGGNDAVVLATGGGIVFGGAGNDLIFGGFGRDVLIGGEGADAIFGNPGDDILISALTQYDDRFASSSHDAAWSGIYAEWANPDHTFAQRVDNLRDGSGTSSRANGSFFLDDSTVHDDASADLMGMPDLLSGSSGNDWFIYKSGEDLVMSMNSAESADDLTIT